MTQGDRSDYLTAANYLYGLKPGGTRFGIDRMRPFAAALGNPERIFPCLHVAGTNGKGSVAAMIESILRAAGWRVGLYTSPHLIHLGERVQVNRQAMSEPRIMDYIHELDPIADAIAESGSPADRPSFFEYMTAMAFLEFQRARCDIAVLEVGLGGEFDATNVVLPEVSVITSIGLDHCEWLGDTLEQIARAKAGIIKEGRPVVIGRMPEAAEHVIRGIACARSAPVHSVRECFGSDINSYPKTNLLGEYQRWNAATARIAVGLLGAKWSISDPAVSTGLNSVKWRGRWERLSIGGRAAVLDASHNAEGARVLDSNLESLARETNRAPVVIVGVLGADRAASLILTICRHAREIYFVVPAQPRATSHAELETLVPASFRGKIFRATVEELFPGGDVCTAGAPNDTIVVTGSIYLLGEVMARLERS